MRCTADCVRPTSAAIDRVDQCVASFGVDSKVFVTTSSTCASLIVGGWPGRGSSSSPSRRCSLKRLRHLVTIGRPNAEPLGDLGVRHASAEANTILERCASACALVGRRAHASSCARSSSFNSISTARLVAIATILPCRDPINASGH